MQKAMQQKIESFHQKIERIKKVKSVEILGYGIYVLFCRQNKKAAEISKKDINISFLAMIHGDETGGFWIFERFLDLFEKDALNFEGKIGLAFGNPEAAADGVRFIEKDLNRSFGVSSDFSLEEKRAKLLEELLRRTNFLIDFHQTIRPSRTAFFIFPFQKASFLFARAIDLDLPIVTNLKGGSFSKDGMCSDEFVNSCDGSGITIECGQRGFDEEQVSRGLELCLKSLRVLQNPMLLEDFKNSSTIYKRIFSPVQIAAYPKNEDVRLSPGFKNFDPVQKGQIIAFIDNLPLVAAQDGFILFPKYKDDIKKNGPFPSELFRIVASVETEKILSCMNKESSYKNGIF